MKANVIAFCSSVHCYACSANRHSKEGKDTRYRFKGMFELSIIHTKYKICSSSSQGILCGSDGSTARKIIKLKTV